MKIVVLSSLALKGVLEKSQAQFEQALGERLELHFDATQAILPRLAAGFRADLVVLTAEAMEDLRDKKAVAETRALGSSGVGIAVRAGARKPDITSVEALKRTLSSASSVAHSKSGASGLYFAGLLERLAIQPKKRVVVVEKGPVGLVVAAGDAEIGVQLLCELAPVPGVDIVGPLPEPLRVLFFGRNPRRRRQRARRCRASRPAHVGRGARRDARERNTAGYFGSAFTSSPHFLRSRLRSAEEPYFAES